MNRERPALLSGLPALALAHLDSLKGVPSLLN